MRNSLPLMLCLLLASGVHGQFEHLSPRDASRLDRLVRVADEFQDLNLTAEQYDQLKEMELARYELRRSPLRGGMQQDEYLPKICETLHEDQIVRLKQMFAQRLMSQNELDKALEYFVGESDVELTAALDELSGQIKTKKAELLKQVDISNTDDRPKIVEFLLWRRKQQVEWLEQHLGKQRTEQLIGRSYICLHRLLVPNGDDEPNTRHMSFGPIDIDAGKIVSNKANELPARPVDVPEGWTLEDAEKQLRELEKRFVAFNDEMADELMAFQMPNFMNRDFRTFHETRLALQAEQRVESQRMALEWVKALRIIQELGGDPLAEGRKARAAELAFAHRSLVCNSPDFLSHIGASGEQCDQLDAIWEERAGGMKEVAYYNRVLAVLEPPQRRQFKQWLFRKHWYSVAPETAFVLTKVRLTPEQSEKVAALGKRLRQIQRERHPRRRRMHTFRVGRLSHDPVKTRANAPLIQLHKDYTAALEEIAGDEEAAAVLLGKAPTRNPNWKRPVAIPDDLTLAQAEKRYAALVQERQALRDEQEDLELALEADFDEAFEFEEDLLERSDELDQRISKLTKPIQLAKRVVEEMKRRERRQANGDQ